MKKILSLIGILFILAVMFVGCQKFIEKELNEDARSTRAVADYEHYYWYKGEKIPITIDESKEYILFNSSAEETLSKVKANISATEVTLSSHIKPLHYAKKTFALTTKWMVVPTTEMKTKSVDPDIIYSAPCFISSDAKELGLSHILYVKLNAENDVAKLIEIADANKVEILGNNEYMPLWYTLSCTNESAGNALEMANMFYETGLFASAQPCFICDDETTAAVNDPIYSSQWALNNTGQNGGAAGMDINYENAQTITKGISSIIVAVLDHGIQLNHPDLLLYSKSYDTETGTSPSKVHGNHGTACAGIIAAKTNNNLGVAGIAPNCPLMSISNRLMGTSDAPQKRADGFNYAWKNGAAVISNSWKSSSLSELLEDAIQAALTNGRNGLGTVVCFSAGNEDLSTVGYPAKSLPDIIAVGAMSINGKRKSIGTPDNEPWGSNYGTELDVMAPGVLIPTTDLTGSDGYASGDYFYSFNGTSSACPHVAGVAALILSVNSNLTQKEVGEIIARTARKVGGYTYTKSSAYPYGSWYKEAGYGVVDAYAAVLEAQNAGVTVFSNKTVTTNTTVTGKNISTNNVTVGNNAKLTFRPTKSFILSQNYLINNGSAFEVSY